MRDATTGIRDRATRRWRIAVLAIAGIAAILVLFPFDWLERVWPAYGRLFDVVFATTLAHMLGHAALFCMAGLLVLAAFPALREKPPLYLASMLVGALAQEGVQSIFKREAPTLGDGRDILLDIAGFVAAYVVVWLVSQLVSRLQR